MDIFRKCKIGLLEEIREKKIYPYFHELRSRQAPIVNMEGGRKIMLGSNNYLGLTENEEVISAGIEALKKYGTGCSGSRFLNGTLDIHKDLESDLAEFLGKEDAITFASGFQSNLGIISALVGRNDYIVMDRENHASIYDACRLSYGIIRRYKHNNMEDLENQLKTIPDDVGKIIITDGVFSMSGDICNLPEICRLAEKYEARVMVDDAHGFGVLGNGGRGTADYYGLTDKVDIIMNTFSKSLASSGGAMVASHNVVEYVRHVSRPFIFCASITPAACATTHAALNYLKAHPELVRRLNELGNYFRKGLKNAGMKIIEAETPIVPIYTYTTLDTLGYCKMMFDNGVYVNPVIAPAAPEGECMIRTSLMASHREEYLDQAVEIIARTLKMPKYW